MLFRSGELRAVNRELEEAAKSADPGLAKVLRALVRFYQTGDLKDWHDFNVLWIQNDEAVDFASGFIEVYRDARGVKGSSQMVVAVVDQQGVPILAVSVTVECDRDRDGLTFLPANCRGVVERAVGRILALGPTGSPARAHRTTSTASRRSASAP